AAGERVAEVPAHGRMRRLLHESSDRVRRGLRPALLLSERKREVVMRRPLCRRTFDLPAPVLFGGAEIALLIRLLAGVGAHRLNADGEPEDEARDRNQVAGAQG